MLRESVLVRMISAATVLALSGCASWGPSPLEKAQEAALEKRQMAGQMEAPKEAPKTPEEKVESGDRLRQQGRNDEAMMAYFAAIRMDPEAIEPRERIAFVHLNKDVDRAEAIFARLIEEDESNSTAWRGLGLAHLVRGEFELSRHALERCLELDADSAGAHHALASVLGLMGRPKEALPHALRAQTLRPRDPNAANAVGMTYLLLEKPGAAEEIFRQVVRLAPDVPAYSNNLGLALGAQKRYDEAYRAFERAGSEQSAHNNLGYTYFLNGEYEMAITEFERAISMNGDEDLAILRNLNAAIDALGKTADAAPPAAPAAGAETPATP